MGSREALLNVDKASPGLFIVRKLEAGSWKLEAGSWKAYLPLNFFKIVPHDSLTDLKKKGKKNHEDFPNKFIKR